MGLPSHCCPQYLRGLKSFMEIARANMEVRSKTTIYCPCLNSRNDNKYSDFEVVYAHLIVRRFLQNYTCWNKHGEEGPKERGGMGSLMIKKGPTVGKTVIRMGKKATVLMVKLMMTSVRSAFWTAMLTSLMRWSTMLKT